MTFLIYLVCISIFDLLAVEFPFWLFAVIGAVTYVAHIIYHANKGSYQDGYDAGYGDGLAAAREHDGMAETL